MRARYNGAILARNNAFADSKLRYLVACKYCKQRKRAASELSLNAGFVTQRVSGLVVENAGQLVCLRLSLTLPPTLKKVTTELLYKL